MKKFISKLIPHESPIKHFYWYRVLSFLNYLHFPGIKKPDAGWPILFGISIPKSGTHLLSQILAGFSKVAPFAPNVQFIGLGQTLNRQQRQEKLEKEFTSLRPLDIAMAHLVSSQKEMERIRSPRFLSYFILRDPRDIVVSHALYVSEIRKEHRLHSYYSDNLHSLDERLMTSIKGVHTSQESARGIARQIEVHMDWLDHPDVHSIRFEDLIHDRYNSLGKIADYFLKRVDTLPVTREDVIKQLELSINPSQSLTFRSGKTGEWKKHFTEEHKKVFKDIAGDMLISLGYESDNDW